jgi:hypothetical protein
VGRYEVSVWVGGEPHAWTDELEVLPLELSFREAPPWQLPVVPGAIEALARVGGEVVAGGTRGALRLLKRDERPRIEALEGWPISAEAVPLPLLAIAAGRSGRAAVAETPASLVWMEHSSGVAMDGAAQDDGAPRVVATWSKPAGECRAMAVSDGSRMPAAYIWWHDGQGERLLRWRPGEAPATVEGPPVPSVADTLVAADLDGDGMDDLVVAGLIAGKLDAHLWRGQALRFVEVGVLSSLHEPTSHLGAVDADADGDLDLLSVGPGQDALWINDGVGHFAEASWRWLPFDRAAGADAAVADLDRDGREDLVIAVPEVVDRLLLGGDASFRDETDLLGLELGAGGRGVVVADLAGDGEPDVLTVRQDGGVRLRVSVAPVPGEP